MFAGLTTSSFALVHRIIAQLKSILKTKELIIEQQEEETKDTVKQVQRPLLAKVQALENQLAEKRIQLQHVNVNYVVMSMYCFNIHNGLL